MNNILANLVALANLAESTFGNAEGVIGAHTGNRSVSVQMREADLLAWCEAHGLTPSVSEYETDYTRYGGGFTTFRRHDAVVSENEVGRILLVSSEVASTRPAASPTSTPTSAPVDVEAGAESAAA